MAFLRDRWGNHAGFSAAAVGMAIALVCFVMGRKKLRGAGDDVPNPLPAEDRSRMGALGVGALVAFVTVVLAAGLWRDTILDQVIDAISIVALLVPIAYFTMMFRSHHHPGPDHGLDLDEARGTLPLSAFITTSWAFATFENNTAPVFILAGVFVIQTIAELTHPAGELAVH